MKKKDFIYCLLLSYWTPIKYTASLIDPLFRSRVKIRFFGVFSCFFFFQRKKLDHNITHCHWNCTAYPSIPIVPCWSFIPSFTTLSFPHGATWCQIFSSCVCVSTLPKIWIYKSLLPKDTFPTCHWRINLWSVVFVFELNTRQLFSIPLENNVKS